jgi:hypothetical protein
LDFEKRTIRRESPLQVFMRTITEWGGVGSLASAKRASFGLVCNFHYLGTKRGVFVCTIAKNTVGT